MTPRRYRDDYLHMGNRRRLVQTLREKGVTDERVLEAIAKVPRHWFVSRAHAERAYEDRALPIGREQTISQPYTVAMQSSWLDAKPGLRVLEIGTGSGYQAAVLATMGLSVYTLERQEDLYLKTSAFLHRQRFGLIRCFFQDGFKGLPVYGPYDRILVTAGAERVPNVLLAQLRLGGSMVVPVGAGQQTMHRITRHGEEDFRSEALGRFRFVPFTEGVVRRTGARGVKTTL